MRLAKYVAVSAIATTLVIAHAMYTREQYFPAMMYLSTSKMALVAFGNLAFGAALVLGRAVKATFLGQLREAEVERLYERTRDAVMETCLAMTIFREEFNARFVAMFVGLLFVKAFHWLYTDRVQYAETAPTLSRVTHIRLAAFMGTLLLVDVSMLSYIIGNTIAKGPSVLLLFGFEYVILVTKLVVGAVKYLIISADRVLDGQWQGKGTCVFYLELVTDLLQLFVYFVFFLIIFAYYGLPVHLVRDLYMTYRNFRKRVEEFIRYRRVTANLDDRFPDSNTEDLSTSDDVCIICRENMEVGAQGGNKPKKLPCGHSFHLHCLRSWLERQQACPTCRHSVLPERERRANAVRQAEEEAQWQQLPPELQAGYVAPEVVERLDREAAERRAQAGQRTPPNAHSDRARRHSTTLPRTPEQAPGEDPNAPTPERRMSPNAQFRTPPSDRTQISNRFNSPSQAWQSPHTFAATHAANSARGSVEGLGTMDDEMAHRVATAVASAVAAASAQAQLAFASVAPFGVPGLVESVTAHASGVAAPPTTPIPSTSEQSRPSFSPIPRDASPAVRVAMEAERQATLDSMQAQVRLIQAQMATLQVQASEEERGIVARTVNRGKETLTDEDDADNRASETSHLIPLTENQPPQREDENEDSNDPAGILRRRRLQHFA